MSAATDEQIIALARIQGRVVVTLDADFHNMLALTGATGPSTIRIRSEGLRSPSMTALILETIAASGVALLAGAMVTTDGRRVRVRHLPIRSGGK